MEQEIKMLLETAIKALKRGMDDGPDGEPVTLTPAEATVLYRVLSERLGLKV